MRLLLTLMVVASSAACDDSATVQPPVPTSKNAGGADGEAARVNGVSISVAEVEQTANALQLEPSVALARLIGKQLLIEEAARRGMDRLDAVQHVARQAAAQALLVSEVERVKPTEAQITEAYETQRARFERPTRRKAVHVLFSVKSSDTDERRAKAMRLATTAIGELRGAAAPMTVWERYKTLGQVDGIEVKAEDLPPAARNEQFVQEFLDGLFSQPGVGVVPTPVETDFGIHAILVTEIIPAESAPMDLVRRTLNDELTVTLRKAALDTLVKELSGRYPVVRDESAIDAWLKADDEALGTAAQ